MRFRRAINKHHRWKELVQDSAELLSHVPPEALVREDAFRDYLTSGAHRGVRFAPSVFTLSSQSLADLWTFINHRAQFDMDAIRFDDFNEAFRKSHESLVS